MPSRTSITLGLALTMFGGVATSVWAASGAVPISEDALWEEVEPYQGKVVTFEVAEDWNALLSVECATLAPGSHWTFEVQDTNGDGLINRTRLPGFRLDAKDSSLTVIGGELGGWCAQDDDEDGAVDLYAHVINDHKEALVELTGVGLGADTTALSPDTPKVALYGLDGTYSVVSQDVVGLPFSAVKLLGGAFIQTGGSYVGGVTSAIVLSGGTVSLSEVTFTSGVADRGVGVNANGGGLLVSNSTFQGGAAMSYGGAIAAQDAQVVLTKVAVLGNSAVAGGGVWVQGGSVTMTGGALTENYAGDRGGGLYALGAEVTLKDVQIDVNWADADGGGVAVTGEEGLLTMSGYSLLKENHAEGIGGGIFVESGQATLVGVSFTSNSASFGGGLGARSAKRVELDSTTLSTNTATIKGGAVHLQEVVTTQLCGLSVSGGSAVASGGGIYALDSALTLGTEDGSCAASQISGAVAPTGAALSFVDTTAAPDGVGLSAVGLQLTQLNVNSSAGVMLEDQAIYVSTSGALELRELSTPGGLGSLALLTAIEAEVTLHDVSVVDEGLTQSTDYAAVQQSVILLSRPASVDLQRARICGFVADGETTGALDMVTVDAPVGDVLIAQSVLWGAASFGALVRVRPDDSGVSDVEVMLRHNSLIGGIKDAQDGAKLDAGSVVATGNLLSRLDVGLILSGSEGATETYNLFGKNVSSPLRDEANKVVRIDDTSTDEVSTLGLVAGFVDTSCAALPELLETSPAVNGGDPEGAPDPDGSIPDQGALPITLVDSDGDGSFDVDDCAPEDPAIGDTVEEIYGDGIDNDCDPTTIDDDEDGDGLVRGVDCDDADATPCPLVSEFFGGRAACGCAAASAADAPRLLWLVPFLGMIWRRRRRQEPR